MVVSDFPLLYPLSRCITGVLVDAISYIQQLDDTLPVGGVVARQITGHVRGQLAVYLMKRIRSTHRLQYDLGCKAIAHFAWGMIVATRLLLVSFASCLV